MKRVNYYQGIFVSFELLSNVVLRCASSWPWAPTSSCQWVYCQVLSAWNCGLLIVRIVAIAMHCNLRPLDAAPFIQFSASAETIYRQPWDAPANLSIPVL